MTDFLETFHASLISPHAPLRGRYRNRLARRPSSHGRGIGAFGHAFMGEGGLGGRGFGAGRKLSSGDLQVVVLALLARRPTHGYELIKAIEEHSGGFYTPSPGVIYPALTYLEEVGYASVAADGAKKLYSITAEGRAYLDEHRQSADAILDQLERIGAKMGRVREIFSGFEENLPNRKRSCRRVAI